MSIQITVNREGKWHCLFPFADDELCVLVRAMAAQVGVDGAKLEISLVDDSMMSAINEQTMHCSGPTNILSFPMFFDAVNPFSEAGQPMEKTHNNEPVLPHDSLCPVLGALVIAPETIEREAFLYGQCMAEYTVFLLAHGLAHLLGFEHSQQMDELADSMYTKALGTIPGQDAQQYCPAHNR